MKTNKFFLASILSLPFISVSLTAYAAYETSGTITKGSSDDNKLEAFGTAIEDHPGPNSDLSHVIDGLEAWIGYMEDSSVDAWHYCTDANGWSSDWEQASDDYSYNDAGDISYYAGHGSSGRFAFDGSSGDNVVKYNETRWGDSDVEVVAIHSCKVLDLNGRKNFGTWNKNDGVHYILGFDSNALDNEYTGTWFGYYLKKGYTVRNAWVQATKKFHDSTRTGSYVRFKSSQCNTYGDTLTTMEGCDPTSSSTYYTSTWSL